MNGSESHKTHIFPASRLATIDIGAAGFSKHHISALFELDVTEARRKMGILENSGEKVSFNAWLIMCISRAVNSYSLIQGIRSGKRKVVVFNDVDVSVMVEKEVGGKKVPLPYVVRRAHCKSAMEIGSEIDTAKTQVIRGEGDYVLGEGKNTIMMKAYLALPGFARRLIWKEILKRPFLVKRQMGTVMITSVGMIGEIRGWIIPVSVHPLCFAVGSIIRKPGVIGEQVEVRDYLYLTALVDHDVIDGAPAVRALTGLKDLVESGYGL